MLWLYTTIFLLKCIVLIPSCASSKVRECCSSNDNLESDLDFSSSVVIHEYIVGFHGYYSTSARNRYITAALRYLPRGSWMIIPRNNPAALHFSDFDVLKVTNLPDGSKEALLRHPCIKHITPQRRITRSLKFYATNGTDYNLLKSIVSTRRKLFWEKDNSVEKKHEHIRVKSVKSERHESTPKDSAPGPGARKLLRNVPQQITNELNAEHIWNQGFRGAGVKVAIFDTGLQENHPHFKRGRIKDRTNWTNENKLDDGLGHGTFVAGVIASDRDCRGFAPESDLYIFRVFTNNQVSYTSWFLDAFNYAIMKRVHVLNLSIGGPDFMDQPFVDKVWELTANGVVMVSAIGNDGPLYGTLNNPADQLDVIGVGGINFDDQIAKFSSRGMTTWELPSGYGRVKPDIVTYGDRVRGSHINGGCRQLSGTSVASPVVAGAVTLLLSSVPRQREKGIINPASVKQALMFSAKRLIEPNIFEQGQGKMNLVEAYKTLRTYIPQVSLSPPYIDLTKQPYMWPYYTQPLYYGAMPVVVNVTILNGLGVLGRITKQPVWNAFVPYGNYLEVSLSYSSRLWPWAGYIAISMTVSKVAANWEGYANGEVLVTVETEGAKSWTVALPIRAEIIPTPSRSKRILWDQFHNLRYPPGYFPRDNLKMKNDPLDWNGDHVHTNFRDLYAHLIANNYYVEVLGAPLTCFDAKEYGTLLIVDPEDEFFPGEITKLKRDIEDEGLSVVVIADWYNTTVMKKLKFYDENTRQWLLPETGGTNIPALNDLLLPLGVALGDHVLDGDFRLGGKDVSYNSGSSLFRFPTQGLVYSPVLHDQGADVISEKAGVLREPVLGLLRGNDTKGNIVIYGDSNCLDSAHMQRECFWLLEGLIEFSKHGRIPANIEEVLQSATIMKQVENLPSRPEKSRLNRYSNVMLAGVAAQHKPQPKCPILDVVRPVLVEKQHPVNLEVSARLKLRDISAVKDEPRPDTFEPAYFDPVDETQSLPTSILLLAVLATLAVLGFIVRYRWKRIPRRSRKSKVAVKRFSSSRTLP